MQQSPKHIIKNFQNRNHAYGRERRLNMAKTVLEHEAHFPKTVGYDDIDRAVFDWVNTSFDLVYDGKKFNTYKLFSNQRISEYGQTWRNLDEKGNLEINFKTVTRESNPQKGTISGTNYNIPSEITFPIFKVKALDENGVEYDEVYSMRQPAPVNLIYNIGVFANSYMTINEMNILMQKEFAGLERYIFPNGYAMPMELNSVSDESDYTIDDRKYYSQVFQIKVMAFIITENDYVVTKVPSRAKVRFASGVNSRRKEDYKFDIQSMKGNEQTISEGTCNVQSVIEPKDDSTEIPKIMEKPSREKEIEIEELCGKQSCWAGTEDEIWVERKIILSMELDYCSDTCEFESEYHMFIEDIELTNVKKCIITVNGTEVKIEDSDVEILKGDMVKIECQLKDETKKATVRLVFYDADTIMSAD
jgi:hypothetical protein